METKQSEKKKEQVVVTPVIASCKLELKHILAYFEHGVYVRTGTKSAHNIHYRIIDGFRAFKDEISIKSNDTHVGFIEEISLCLYPFSYDVLKSIYSDSIYSNVTVTFTEYSSFVRYKFMGDEFMDIISNMGHSAFNNCPYWVVKELLKRKVDIFGLIKSGLAIDANTIDNV